MRKALYAAMFVSAASSAAQASTIAIIDSGFDSEHEVLKDKLWTNQGEIPGDQIDNDGNGKIDDVIGWNFADNDAQIIDYTLQENYTPDIEKVLEMQISAINGTATEGEIKWLKEKLADSEFIGKLQTFANYAHGSHVAGIASRGNDNAKLMAIKLISTKSLFGKLKSQVQANLLAGRDVGFIQEFVIKLGMVGIAYQQGQSFRKIADYLSAHGVSVANGSFGTGMPQVRGLITPLLTMVLGEEPPEELVEEYGRFFIGRIISEYQKIISQHPEILFVFAAGNDGADNDEILIAPANVKLDNVITVGASVGNVAVATFSNYGASRVDLFAPGVGVRSSVPRQDMYLPLSGTSMAAPEVTRIAAVIKDRNPDLKPADIREILMGTIDRKGFLKGKSFTEGVVNDKRAWHAAEQSKTLSIREAVKSAKKDVADKADNGSYIEDKSDFSLVTPF